MRFFRLDGICDVEHRVLHDFGETRVVETRGEAPGAFLAELTMEDDVVASHVDWFERRPEEAQEWKEGERDGE